jgi:serine protease DegQ
MRPAPTLLVLAAAAAFGGFAATAIRDAVQAPAQAAEPAAALPVPTVAALPMAVDGQAMPSLAPMLQRVTPSVVSVQAAQRRQVSPFGNDPFFRRMFPELSQERIARSLGSGVIVDAGNGYVLTNHHVIENADEVSVTLSDGRTLEAEFIGSDPDTDVALMRIAADGLTALPLSAAALSVGDFVVAVGNPFGVGQTVTSGIVSAVGRSNVPGVGYQNFIQTDASINPGNSGGALVNLRGELVGINTASFNPRGSAAGNIGLGFAIPANLAREVMRQLMAYGEVRRGSLGLDGEEITPFTAKQLDLPANQRGALVARVYRGSPAEAAGVRPGDVVIAANGERIDSAQALRNLEGLLPVDQQVRLDLLRDGQRVSVSAILKAQAKEVDGAQIDPRLAGATLTELPERFRQQGLIGVIASKVETGSRAARNGLRAGDRIGQVNRRSVADLPAFRSALASEPQDLVLSVARGGRFGYLVME